MREEIINTYGKETIAIQKPIFVNGTYNFRDVGGYRAPEGIVRRGKLFRSDGLARLGEAGRKSLRDLGVRVVIDLRDDFEASGMPDDIDGLDIQHLHLPVFEGSGVSMSTGVTLVRLYEKILFQHRDVVIAVLREIADTGNNAVVVHCTAGKDRTGIVVALALLAVGVDRDVVIADYAATQANLGGPWLEEILTVVRSHGVEVTPDLRVILGESPPEALAEALDALDRQCGGVREYLLEAGMDDIELAKLRSVLLEPV